MLIYLVPAIVTSAFCIHAVVKDSEASIYDAETLGYILLISVVWPIALPSILHKKLQDLNHRRRLSYPIEHCQLLPEDV